MVHRSSDLWVIRRHCFEDSGFHDAAIFAPDAFFGNTQNCVRILLREGEDTAAAIVRLTPWRFASVAAGALAAL